MAEPFLGEIRLYSFNFPPQGWAFCDGQLLPINQYSALFSLMGTYYGGDGVRNFALPNLQGRVAIHQSSEYLIGESFGESMHSLTVAELPSHAHSFHVGESGTTVDPTGGVFATPAVNSRLGDMYSTTGGSVASSAAVAISGSGQPHENKQPFTSLNYCVAMVGIFPSRN